MNSGRIISQFLFLSVFTFSATCLYAANVSDTRNIQDQNPHADSGACSVCHVASVETLRGWFVWPATKRQLVADPTTLCQKCHGVSFGHGVGKKTHMNRAGLPVSDDGVINCALTCHDMHISGVDDASQQRYHLRYPLAKLCVSCHDK